ncbi:MAG: alpha/beta hydrolase, partial [Actinomycetia bacterium]|nr:alpha/beta hydrolase [Actinomycetes bacterium]
GGPPPFPGVTRFGDDGPFPTTNGGEGPTCTLFRPEILGEEGRKHPIILWGNGTTGFPAAYGPGLTHWASHGFVVAAANTGSAGTGEEMLACLEYLATEDTAPGSDYEGRLDLLRVGASGHSQGGGGALMAGANPSVVTTAPMAPFVILLGHDPASQSHQTGPMFLLSGATDTTAAPLAHQKPVFDNSNVPVFWGTLSGAGHTEALLSF